LVSSKKMLHNRSIPFDVVVATVVAVVAAPKAMIQVDVVA